MTLKCGYNHTQTLSSVTYLRRFQRWAHGSNRSCCSCRCFALNDRNRNYCSVTINNQPSNQHRKQFCFHHSSLATTQCVKSPSRQVNWLDFDACCVRSTTTVVRCTLAVSHWLPLRRRTHQWGNALKYRLKTLYRGIVAHKLKIVPNSLTIIYIQQSVLIQALSVQSAKHETCS